MKSTMKIFKAEKRDGLVDAIRAGCSLAYVTCLEPVDPATSLAKKLVKALASEEHPENTLFPMRDVLVTTGWNLNTDVFDRGEIWAARYTPENHPLNFEHDEKRIIGHITTSQAVDADFNLLGDDLSVDELPEKFHIVNGSVIYRTWGDKEQETLIENTIAEIQKGEWYVSMECIFRGFDYAVVRPDGTKAIIPRNEDSAFLTKYLRHYGGAGVYKDVASGAEFKLGRVLRNITFNGKGLVRKPANPESVILNHVSAFVSSFADLGYIKAGAEVTSTETPERNNMSDSNNDIKKLEDRVAELVKQNEALATQLKQKDGEAAKAEIDGLKAELKTRDQKIETLETSMSELNKTVVDLTKRADDAEAAKKVADEELGRLKAEKVEKTRLDLLTGKGASAEKAAELVKKFARFTDEEFNDIVETLSAAWKKKPEDVIDNAVNNRGKDAALAAKSDFSEDSKDRIAKASKYIGSFLRYTKSDEQTQE